MARDVYQIAIAGHEPFEMTGDEMTQAIQRYARKHNEYARTVRQNTDLRSAAVREWCDAGRPTKK